MRPVRVVTDSTADIPPELADRLNITIVPSLIMFGPETYRDGVDLSKAQFYEKLVASRTLPTTAASSISVYEGVYRRLAETADEIISIQLAGKLSAIHNSAVMGAQGVEGARIVVVDSGQVTMGYGWMAIAAAEAAQQGKRLDEIVALIEGMKPRARVLAVLDTLEYVHRGGRVSWARAMLGTLLRVKPMIEVYASEVRLLERTRTTDRALARLLERVEGLGALERAMVLHTNAPGLAERVADQLQALYPKWERLTGPAGVTIATHAGPGAVGIACVSAA